MPIISVTQIRIPATLSGGNLRAENLRPLSPAEEPALVQRQRHRKDLRFPGSVEYRTCAISGLTLPGRKAHALTGSR